MPDAVVDFEDENGVDDARALQEACNNLSRLAFEVHDLQFYFQQVEIKAAAVGVRKNFTKFQVLASIIPKNVIDEVKPLLRKKESEFSPANDAYKQLKLEILRIFGPNPEETMNRALGRVLSGTPSSLARALVNDLCPIKQLDCSCCPGHVTALWKRQLPQDVRAHIADKKLTKETFNEITQSADNVFA